MIELLFSSGTELQLRRLSLRIATIVLFVHAALLAACGDGAAGIVELDFWAVGREGQVVATLVEDFERENPGIRVNVQKLPWSAAHAKLLTAFAGKATPDLAQLGNTWISEFATLGALEPLDGFVARSAAVDVPEYFHGIWQASAADGVQFGIPWYVDTRLLFYRADLLAAAGFDAPPITRAEWRRAMVAVKQGAGADSYAVLLPLNEFEPLLAMALRPGVPLLTADGTRGNFRSDEFIATLDFYLGLFDDGLAPHVNNTELPNVWAEFERGYFAFYVSGPWNLGEFRRRLPANRQHIWQTSPLPGADGTGTSSAGGSSLVLFRDSPHKQEAWKLVEYLSRPDVQRRFYDLTGDLPPRRDSWRDARFDDSRVQAFFEQLEQVEPVPSVPEWERIANEMRLVTERAVHSGWSAERAAAELDRRADRILEKRRWLKSRESASAR